MSDDSYLGEASRVVPAEWERHSRTIVSWPTREAIWNPIAPQACEEYVQIIEAILPYEPVVVVCRQQDEDRVASLIPKEAVLVAHPIDDGWIRDSGPLAIRVGESLVAVDFAFNSWGGRFAPWTGDATVGEMLARYCDVPREYVPFVLEGGAISFNGDGTALVIEECVLNKNRNGAVSRKRFESLIGAHLGVDKVIWLPFGLLEDLAGTDGHVDNVAIFVDVDRVLVQMVDQMNPNFGRLSRKRGSSALQPELPWLTAGDRDNRLASLH
jgi:agmatine deiminase